MSIAKSEVWISEVTQYGPGTTVNLGSRDDAPSEFASEDEIVAYVRDTFDIGEYHVLGIQDTVTVEPVHEMYSEYTDADMDVLDAAYERFADSDRVVSVIRQSDPAGRETRVNHSGVTLELSPYECDLVVEVFNPDSGPVEVVRDWVADRADGLRVVGYKRDTYYKRRGARGQATVRVALKRDVGAMKALVESIMQEQVVQFCAPADALMFAPRVSPRNDGAEQVIVTNLGLERDTQTLGNDPTPQDVLDLVSSDLGAFQETLEEETSWVVTDFGFVTAAGDGEFYRLAIGVTPNPYQ